MTGEPLRGAVRFKVGFESGFTLLEILIGLVLLSIMMTLLFGSIRMGAKVWDTGEKRAFEVDRRLIIQNFLRRHLTRARPVIDDFTDRDEPVFSFSGTQDSVQFVSLLPDSAGRGGMHLFKLAVEDSDAGKVLLVKLSAFYPSLDGVEQEIEDVRLINDIDTMALAYFGLDEGENSDDEASWQDDWEDRNDLPQLVKLTVRMKDGTEWPPLIVHPLISPLEQDAR